MDARVVVVDDEDRENEGDLVIAADMVTPQAVNFMATHGRGLICLAMTGQRLDELDRLFSCSFCSEVCGLFRSWHNARANDPDGPWRNLTQILCYATEAHLLIPDLNQSPFNVGVRVPLQDFSDAELQRLNELYGRPLSNEREVARDA